MKVSSSSRARRGSFIGSMLAIIGILFILFVAGWLLPEIVAGLIGILCAIIGWILSLVFSPVGLALIAVVFVVAAIKAIR